MEEHIDYYTDLLAHLNEQIIQESIKLMDYETTLLQEQKTMSHYSLFKKWFGSNMKFINQLEKMVLKSTQNIENYKKEIEEHKEKLVAFGTQHMIEESNEIKMIEHKINRSIDVSVNIEHMIAVMKQAKEDSKYGLGYYEHSKRESFKSNKKPYFEKCFVHFLSALNKVKDLKRYMSLEGFSTTDNNNQSFNKNILEIINDVLQYEKIFNNTIIEQIKVNSNHPHFDLLESKIDVMESLSRNIDVIFLALNREMEKLKKDHSEMINKKNEIEDSYRIIFLNKIKKDNALIIF